MTDNNIITVDPWLKNNQHDTLPNNCLFVCAQVLDLGATSIVEALYFQRSDTDDELWVVHFAQPSAKQTLLDSHTGFAPPTENIVKLGPAIVVSRRGEQTRACATLLEYLIRSRVSHAWPTHFIKGGLINEDAFKTVVHEIKHELKRNVETALKNETAIILKARELGLHVRPAGTNQNNWLATCPGTNHALFITAEENEFGCGYCSRKGGVNELIEFVRERKQWVEDRRVNTLGQNSLWC